MPTEQQVETTDSTTTDETSEEQEQEVTSETEGNDTKSAAQQQDEDKASDKDDKEPTALKSALAKERADLRAANKELKATRSRVTELEAQVKELAPKAEETDAIQTRYDRLEAFLLALDNPVSKILDSRTFSSRLFETDDKIEDIIKDWYKANPSATSQALGSKGAGEPAKNTDMNNLLRAALNGK